eukprot:6202609-Pleurochrysis_carterae.AAC.4
MVTSRWISRKGQETSGMRAMESKKFSNASWRLHKRMSRLGRVLRHRFSGPLLSGLGGRRVSLRPGATSNRPGEDALSCRTMYEYSKMQRAATALR